MHAQVFCKIVDAKNKQEAKEIAEKNIRHWSDPSISEMDKYIIDEPIIYK